MGKFKRNFGKFENWKMLILNVKINSVLIQEINQQFVYYPQ